MTPQEHHKLQDLRDLRGIVLGRWFLIAGLFLLAVIQKFGGIAIVGVEAWQGIILFVSFALLNLFYHLSLRHPPKDISDNNLHRIALMQVTVDQLFFTVMIYFAGGVESVAYILYLFPILAATILYSDLQIISVSLLSIGLYTTLIIAEYSQLIPHLARYATGPTTYGHVTATLSDTLSVDLIILFVALFAVFINRIIRDRESEITLERDKVRSILNSLEDGIIMLDSSQRVILMNPPARDMLELYDGFTGSEIKPERFAPNLQDLVTEILVKPKKKRLGKEVTVITDAGPNYIQVDSMPIIGAGGFVLNWVKVLHDVTRDRELDQIKSDFISIAAHQLRTPLGALKWFFRMVLDGDAGSITKKQRQLFDQAFVRNNEVIEIVNNLLDISEIEEGRFPYDFAQTNLDEVLGAIVERSQLDANRRNITVEWQRPSSPLPAVLVDQQKLKIALQNLVDNGIKYSHDRGTVTITSALRNQRYWIEFHDDGIGIPEHEQNKIFSKFFRGKNAKEHVTTGSGLGLYIVKNIIEKHRGKIWFESTENKGTTFFVSLPVIK